MPAVFLEHHSSLEHDTGEHPEQPARIHAIHSELQARGWLGLDRLESRPVSRAVLESVHSAQHIEGIRRVCARGGGHLDPDTVASPQSYEAALHAAGGATQLVELLTNRETEYGFSAHRPPGHHAVRDRAMGFCLFNNVAIAARHALDACGCERVLILDWDVHHGNGTNDIFHASNRVLFVSIHQSPLYPGSGSIGDVGSGTGTGYTVNLPVAAGSGDEVFISLVSHVAVPLALGFKPDLILISAGYDAHREDPLAGCAVTEAGYAAMSAAMRNLARELGIPLGLVLEGGYALGALARSVVATLQALADPDSVLVSEPPLVPYAREARRRLSQWWPQLG